MENNANQLNSMLCKRNCGFFGNAACDGYCSKCYKDHVKRQNSGSAAGRVTPTALSSTSTTPTLSAAAAVVAAPTAEETTSSTLAQVQAQAAGQLSSDPLQIHTSSSTQSLNGALNNLNTLAASTAPIPIPSRNKEPTNPTSGDEPNMSESVSGSSLAIATSVTSETGTSLSGTSLSLGSEKKKRSRCCIESCKRKVGLTGFDCRCGGLYCWEHRYSDKHDCKFDYKELGQDQIRKNNPIVVGEKIQKI